LQSDKLFEIPAYEPGFYLRYVAGNKLNAHRSAKLPGFDSPILSLPAIENFVTAYAILPLIASFP